MKLLTYQPDGYVLFGRGERHGSLEVTWHSKEGGLDRFVSTSVTPAPVEAADPAQHGWHTVEVWAGASDGERFARHLVMRHAYVATADVVRGEPSLANAVKSAQSEAVIRANALGTMDLTEVELRTVRRLASS